MPREMNTNAEETYRAVLNRTGKRHDGSDFSYDTRYGPYSRKGNAKGILSTELRHAQNWAAEGTVVTGWVERAETKWERIEE